MPTVCVCDANLYTYVMTYSFPCTDLSSAGKQLGMSRDSGTRSGLLWQVERLLKEMSELPQILLMENVPEVVSSKNVKDFAEWMSFLDGLGYRSKYEILNSKNYGVPQNRERCFMVSWLGDYYYDFPEPFQLDSRLKDVLEPIVDEKYYLHDEQASKLKLSSQFEYAESVAQADTNGRSCWLMNRSCISSQTDIAPTLMARDYKGFGNQMMTGVVEHDMGTDKIIIAGSLNPNKEVQDRVRVLSPKGICQGLRATDHKDPPKIIIADGIYTQATEQFQRGPLKGVSRAIKAVQHDAGVVLYENINCKCVGMLDISGQECIRCVYDANYIAPTLTTMGGGNREPKIVEPVIGAIRGRNPDNPSDRTPGIPTQQRLEVGSNISNALTTVQKDNVVVEQMPFRVRRLTPKECWRLMGFDDDSFDRASEQVSNTQLYKQAGNSIVVNVLMAIFNEMVN